MSVASEYDVIVVLGLETQPATPHVLGSHHGATRIIREAYFEHPSYVALLQSAFAEWAALESASGTSIFRQTGCVSTSGTSGGECFPGALESARLHGLEHEVLTAAELAARCPGYRLEPGMSAVLEARGGVLCPERAVAAHAELAQRAGATLLCGQKVVAWRSLTDAPGSERAEVDVEGRAEPFVARRLVLVPGAWLPRLVPELAPLLKVERQVVCWFQTTPEFAPHFAPEAFPVFVLDDETGCYYGFPADADSFKIGRMHHRCQRTDPDAVDREVTAEDEAVLRQAVARYFPGADGPCTRSAVCLFTNTPDEHFVVDAHPCHRNVLFCSACSGHGFKFASVVGRILADLVEKDQTSHDISLFRLSKQRKGHAQVLEAFQKQ
ncbi:FAD dependent oxidoreductase [Helicosporidium sp. ATCC 50920]|nr:FAD dependent oxidoreductase [Helicosporidium sp. ATCC 50920]|eukprot:KDD77068.1 FAD dependent oxidoreductase [Helicosporidium sp. ATCC 50920]